MGNILMGIEFRKRIAPNPGRMPCFNKLYARYRRTENKLMEIESQ